MENLNKRKGRLGGEVRERRWRGRQGGRTASLAHVAIHQIHWTALEGQIMQLCIVHGSD